MNQPLLRLLLGLAAFAGGAAALLITLAATSSSVAASCDPAYPDPCIPIDAADLDCAEIEPRNFRVLPPDPHGFDTDADGIGCEDPQGTPYPVRDLANRVVALFVACDSCARTTPVTPTPSTTAVPSPSPSPSPAFTPTATATSQVCGGATAAITALNKTGNPESVTVSGSGLMTGWYIISESGNQRFNFPSGYQLTGSVTIVSASNAVANPPSTLLWTTANIWNNQEDDDAFLYDCEGTLRGTFEDGD